MSYNIECSVRKALTSRRLTGERKFAGIDRHLCVHLFVKSDKAREARSEFAPMIQPI
jgi:hypothetical protein